MADNAKEGQRTEKERRKKARRFAYIASVALLLVTIFSGVLTFPHLPPNVKVADLDTSSLRELMFALVVFFIFFVASVFLSALVFIRELDFHLDAFSDEVTDLKTDLNERVTRIEDDLDEIVDARYLGVGAAALESILERARKAQEVRNTLVLFNVPEHEVAATCYTKDQIDRIHRCIEHVLVKGRGTWTDIVSQEVVNSSALDWLGFMKSVRHGAPEEAGAALDRYRIRRLREAYPIINFMILRYENDKEEVIFGWGHHSEDPGGRVFMTRSSRLIAVFDLFWHMLEKDSTPFKPDVRRPLASADITGLWFSVAYDIEQDRDREFTGMPPDAKPSNAALVSIGIDDNRNITVKGIIVEQGDHNKTLESVAADLEENQLWFAGSSSATIFNAGWYRFVHPNTESETNGTTSQSLGIQEFYGHFFDPVKAKHADSWQGDEEHYTIRQLSLFGRRITTNWPPGTGLKRDPAGLPDDPKAQAELMDLCQKSWLHPVAQKRWKGPSMISNDKPTAKAELSELGRTQL